MKQIDAYFGAAGVILVAAGLGFLWGWPSAAIFLGSFFIGWPFIRGKKN